MIEFSEIRVFLCTIPTKMNYSFDTLMGLAQQIFDEDPLSGHLFLFVNRERDRLKILFWDHDGLAIFYKKHVSDCPATFLCTRIGQRAHNRARWLVAASGMDASTRICGPRRCPMSPGVALIAPPRARRPSEA
jgi:hypothetical protein